MARTRKTTLVRKGEIIEAVKRLIIRYGSEHVTVRKIAKGVGITEAAVYRHFRSKREILSFLAEHVEENLVLSLRMDQAGQGTSLETLDSIMRNHIFAIDQRKGISFQIIAEILSFGDRKINQKITEAINKYLRGLEGLLAEGVKAGELRSDLDLKTAAMLWFGMIQGLVTTWALAEYRFDLEERYASLWNLFCSAVASR